MCDSTNQPTNNLPARKSWFSDVQRLIIDIFVKTAGAKKKLIKLLQSHDKKEKIKQSQTMANR
jgi:hypothetical protein